MESQALSPFDAALQLLSTRERTAYDKYHLSHEKQPLGLDVALGMYELYLNGHSFEEIQKVNKRKGSTFELGQIVDAGIRYEWAARRRDHQQDLFDSIALKVRQTQVESVSFTADLISAAHKQYGERLKSYLQSGDENDLGDLKIQSMKMYREAVDMLMKLTGQEAEKSKAGGTQVNVITSGGTAKVEAVQSVVAPKKLTAGDFHRLLELVEGSDDDEA